MQLKFVAIFFLLYFFAILQSSFFTYFRLFGALPDLVFCLFFVFVFFSDQNSPILGWEQVFVSVSAGFFLDAISPDIFGKNIAIMVLVAFLLKQSQKLLRNKYEHPFYFFLPLFFLYLLVYYLLSAGINFKISFWTGIIYNMAVASAFFWICKKFVFPEVDNRQLKLFQ